MDSAPEKHRLIAILKQTPKKYYLIGVVLCLALLYGVAFFIPKSVKFSYAGATCASQFTLFPSLHKGVTDRYDVSFEDTWQVGSVEVASGKTCFAARQAPEEGAHAEATAPFGWWLARKHYTIETPAAPVANTARLAEAVPVTKAVVLPLSDVDALHAYRLKVEDKYISCGTKQTAIECDLPSLELAQGAQFDYELTRAFKTSDEQESIHKGTLTTLKATKVTKTSIKPNQTVYNKPRELTLTLDKPLRSAKVSLKQGKETLKTEQKIDNNKITITVDEDLAREKTFEVVLDNVEATDESTLIEPYTYTFSTSGGPKVTNVSVGATGVAQSAQVILTFDQKVSEKDAASFVKFKGGNATVQRQSDTQLVVQLASLPLCQPFSITVEKGIPSEHTIKSKAAWSFASRVTCKATINYGTSVQGRPLVAYLFGGSGPVTMYTGAIHGNESSSSALMQLWMQELEANPSRFEGKRVLVVPTINPDGLAANTRTNARNVNLSRNFPTENWVKDINDTDGTHKGGGGSKPLSEPESAAIAKLTTQYRPRLLLSFHAIGSLVVGDPGGYSAGYAAKYSSMVGYRDATGSGGTFDYDITGSYEDWTYRNAGIPSMVIELGSYTYASIGTHRSALWAMLD